MNRAAAFAANAPLMSIPESMPPANGAAEWWRGVGGLRLRAALWTPEVEPRGSVIISPGRAEAIEKYYETIADLQARGFVVLAHDWRGQGLSARLLPDRLKGHARAVEEFLDDYARLLDTFEQRLPRPWIMIGHSMGGALNLLSLLEGEDRFAGALLSSPMLRIRTGKRSHWSARFASRWNVRHGKAGEYVLDDYDDPFEHTFDQDALTADQARWDRWREHLYACPHLALGGVTWGWLAFGLEVGERILKSKTLKRLSTPLVVVQAADDRLLWKTAARWVCRRVAVGARYIEVAGARHEILMETDDKRTVFFDEFDYLADHVAPAKSAPVPRAATLQTEVRAGH